jgi:hypothetical protein
MPVRQRLSKNVPVATDTYATIEELLEAVFSVRSVHKVESVIRWELAIIFCG